MSAAVIAHGERIEFWQIGNEVYRVPAGGVSDIHGLPMARRWECSISHWQHYRKIYDWVSDVPVAEPFPSLLQSAEDERRAELNNASKKNLR